MPGTTNNKVAEITSQALQKDANILHLSIIQNTDAES
jgi:hypothetical protein